MSRQHWGKGWLIVAGAVIVACLCLVCLAAGGVYLVRNTDFLDEITAEFSSTNDPGIATVGPLQVAGGTLRLVEGEPVTLDPALVEDSISAEYVEKIFAGLVSLDAQLEVRPELADRWEISTDGTHYTFHLRDDAQFQDGRPITAQDVQYSLERACDPETGSRVADVYLSDIVGVAAREAGEANEIAGVRVIDERTIELIIDAPKAYFLAKLTNSVAAVVDRQNVAEGDDWTSAPNGSGPYRLAEWTDERIVLQASDTYFRGQPAIMRVIFDLQPADPATMYETGELDVVPVGLDDYERVQDPYNPLHRELVSVPALDVWYVGFNTQIAPFDDVKVRQAFLRATDREAIANVMFKKSVVPAWGVLPPGLPGYSEDVVHFPLDPDLARQLLAESRYGSAEQLPPITFVVSAGSSGLAEALVSMYKDVLGVQLEIEEVEWADYLQDLAAGRYQMFSLGWNADYPDAQNFLDIQFHGGSGGNMTGYSNPHVDSLLEQARVEQDETARNALYRQAEDLILTDAPWIPIYHGVDYSLVKPYVRDLTITPQGMYVLEKASIADE